MNLVTCATCNIPSRAPADVGVCQRCRQRHAHAVRDLHAAVEVIERLDLEALSTAVTYPFRVPLSNVDVARLARAARPLQEALRELRAAERRGPQRAERASEVKDEDASDVALARRVRRR